MRVCVCCPPLTPQKTKNGWGRAGKWSWTTESFRISADQVWWGEDGGEGRVELEGRGGEGGGLRGWGNIDTSVCFYFVVKGGGGDGGPSPEFQSLSPTSFSLSVFLTRSLYIFSLSPPSLHTYFSLPPLFISLSLCISHFSHLSVCLSLPPLSVMYFSLSVSPSLCIFIYSCHSLISREKYR